MPHKVGSGAILGIASEDGLPAKKRIVLMDRTNMRVVKQTISDDYGAYALTGLNPDANDYIVFAVDDDGVTKKSALIFDYVRPIPAHQGGYYWANWYYLAMQREPIAMFLGVTEDENPNNLSFPYGVGRNITKANGLIVQTNIPAVTTGAPNLPMVLVDNGYLLKHAMPQGDLMATTGGNTQLSCECILDTAAVTAKGFGVSLIGSRIAFETSGEVAGTLFMSVRYDPVGNIVSVYRKDGVYSGYNEAMGGQTVSASYVLPSELVGTAVHIAATLDYGVQAKIYINGLLVATESLLGTNSRAGNSIDRNRFFAMAGGTYIQRSGQMALANQVGGFSTSMFSFYTGIMSAGDVASSYAALFSDVIPTVTGYLKAVVSDLPLYFYRLHDQDESLFALDSLRYLANISESKLTKVIPTKINNSSDELSVVGGSGMIFSGGGLRGSGLLLSSTAMITVDFFAKPNDIAPYVKQDLLLSISDNVVMFSISLNASKQWRLGWREGGSAQTVVFAHTVDFSASHHYAFTVNKLTLKANLYVDAVLVETAVVTAIRFDMPAVTLSVVNEVFISGKGSSTVASVENPYFGYLSEVAIYPAELSQASIKNHYDARTVI